jgi:hypothetical protein
MGMVRRILLCALVAGGALAQNVPDAATRFAQLLKKVKDAREEKNEKSVLTASLTLARLLHDSGPATEQLAMVYAEMGDQRHALRYLREFVAMGQCDHKLASRPEFRSLGPSPEFRRIRKEMRANQSPVERASPAVKFRDANLLPEDIDYDRASKSFYVTSVLEKKIVRVRPDGTQTDFAKAPDRWPMLAIKIDARRGIVWATEVALDGFVEAPSKDWGRSALVCLRLSDGKLIRKIDAPRTALGDMALLPNGDVIASDGDGGGVYRVPGGVENAGWERIDAGQFISPQTPAPERDGLHVFVPDYAGGVGLLDLRTKQVRWVDAERRHAMQGIDGLYLWQTALVATQNGTSPERVVRFRLETGLQVSSERIIERSTPTLGDPTHGVVVQNVFYYIANSGWNVLDQNGKLKPGSKMTPALIMATPLAGQ